MLCLDAENNWYRSQINRLIVYTYALDTYPDVSKLCHNLLLTGCVRTKIGDGNNVVGHHSAASGCVASSSQVDGIRERLGPMVRYGRGLANSIE